MVNVTEDGYLKCVTRVLNEKDIKDLCRKEPSLYAAFVLFSSRLKNELFKED